MTSCCMTSNDITVKSILQVQNIRKVLYLQKKITRSPDTRRPIILMDLGERWWWNKEVDGAIIAKRQAFKAWKAGKCTRASYNTAKRISRRMVNHARHETDKVVYDGIDHKSSDIFSLTNQMRKENVDVVGNKPVKNDAGEMSMSEEAKQNAWAEHYERLLNVEFDWDPDHLSNEPPLEGPPIPITIDMVKKVISKMKSGKAAGPSGIVVEMIKAAGDTGATMIRDLATAIIRDGKVSTDREQSFIVCLYKGKGDALDRGNYRGLKLTEQAMKILERIVDGLKRQVVSIDDSQFGFVPGRGTTDAIFVVRQLQEKYLAVNKRLYMAFVDLEKAFDCVPRKVIWWALRKLGVEDWIVRLVQGMHTNARSRVRVGEGFSKEFEVKSTRDPYSVPCSSSLCWRPCHVSFGLVFPGRTYMQMILSSLLTP